VVEVRILVSADHSGKAFNLRCEIREKLLVHLQGEHSQALPRTRATVVGAPDRTGETRGGNGRTQTRGRGEGNIGRTSGFQVGAIGRRPQDPERK
jgi:hypothetical protein